ncbi:MULTISPECIES: tetratricopeptide repeat protein [Nostocales]|uniref:Tetratricopeptide repeat protein n=3 Tax=Nostocales TaxID=1161 RepID=A0A0C1MWN9_9CYAN|nr:tetratricopeptide repeat protein [Tolypothrix bouteillei]KAF3889929.1 tetratricopeptide repeat protein [Tolypothrix bouteillei VB521301]
MENTIPPYKYPFWVVILSAAVLCSLLYSLLSLPKYFVASKELKAGRNAYVQKQYDEAIKSYELVLIKVPNSKEAKISLAEVYFAKGQVTDIEKAVSYLKGVHLNKSDRVRLIMNMPEIYQQYFENIRE